MNIILLLLYLHLLLFLTNDYSVKVIIYHVIQQWRSCWYSWASKLSRHNQSVRSNGQVFKVSTCINFLTHCYTNILYIFHFILYLLQHCHVNFCLVHSIFIEQFLYDITCILQSILTDSHTCWPYTRGNRFYQVQYWFVYERYTSRSVTGCDCSDLPGTLHDLWVNFNFQTPPQRLLVNCLRIPLWSWGACARPVTAISL